MKHINKSSFVSVVSISMFISLLSYVTISQISPASAAPTQNPPNGGVIQVDPSAPQGSLIIGSAGSITTGIWSATPISISKGGTGATVVGGAGGALSNLGAAAAGNNSDITALNPKDSSNNPLDLTLGNITKNVIMNGGLSIGTNSPTNTRLHIIAGTGMTGQLGVQSTTDTVGDIAGIGFGTSAAVGRFKGAIGMINTLAGGGGMGDLIFAVNNNLDASLVSSSDERMRITRSGNVGIGTSTPNSKLEVVGDSDTTGRLKIAGNSVLTLPSNNPETGPWNPIWNAVGTGKSLFSDEEFATGNNSVSVYNNSGGSAVTITRQTSQTGAPNTTGTWLKVTYDGVGATSPNFGGVVQSFTPAANRTYAQRFRAKVPVGKILNINENSQGTNSTSYWLSNNVGTGKWEDYIRVSHAGNTGTFSSGGHISVSGGSGAFDWYIATMNIYEVTGTCSGCIGLSQWTTSGANIYNNNTGNVGIGMTGAVSKLDVQAASGLENISWRTPTNRLGLLASTGTGEHGSLHLYGSGVEVIRLASSPNVSTYFNAGNVGIGTSTPSTLLDVRQNAVPASKDVASIYTKDDGAQITPTNLFGSLKISNEWSGSAPGANAKLAKLMFHTATDNGWNSYGGIFLDANSGSANNKGNLKFATADSNAALATRMTIDGNGNVGIGTTSPGDKLAVNGGITILGANSLKGSYGAGGVTTNFASGDLALTSNTSGGRNTAIGNGALRLNSTGVSNTAMGYYSAGGSTVTGINNTLVGDYAGVFLTSGGNNVVIGYVAGYTGNINPLTTGSGNVLIGNNSGLSSSGDSNSIAIGQSAIGVGSNTAVLGNASITKTVLRGALSGNYGLTPNYAGWGAYGTGDGGVGIYNDNGSYKKLMIVGNNSAGGSREVGIWDNLTVNGNATIAGALTAPTAAAGTNTTQVATTAFVQAAVGGSGGIISSDDQSFTHTAPQNCWYLDHPQLLVDLSGTLGEYSISLYGNHTSGYSSAFYIIQVFADGSERKIWRIDKPTYASETVGVFRGVGKFKVYSNVFWNTSQCGNASQYGNWAYYRLK